MPGNETCFGLLKASTVPHNHRTISTPLLDHSAVSWNAHFYLFLPIFCILHNQVTIPSLHVMARKYSHVMVCHMSDCVVLVDQARDESCG